MSGDGHTAAKIERMKEADDAIFNYRFTWIEAGRERGWVIHYQPKHSPVSSEIGSALKFLGLQSSKECPEFEFESCLWRSIAFVSRGGFLDSNAESAHGWFDAHAARFSGGLEKLLAANAEVEQFGLRFLPFDLPQKRLTTDIERKVVRPVSTRAIPKSSPTVSTTSQQFDVALSFAGAQREHAQQLASILKDAGYSVFYDDFFPEYLWGKNLVDTFAEIYRKQARFCVIFVSREYKERNWTNHERQNAQARALADKGKEYILPIRVDDTELDGMPPTIGYVPIQVGISKIGDMLMQKLKT